MPACEAFWALHPPLFLKKNVRPENNKQTLEKISANKTIQQGVNENKYKNHDKHQISELGRGM